MNVHVFEGRASLTTVDLKQITSFGENAFLLCSCLTDINYCSLDPPNLVSDSAFVGTSDQLHVYVPYAYEPDNFGTINVKFIKILDNECVKQRSPTICNIYQIYRVPSHN